MQLVKVIMVEYINNFLEIYYVGEDNRSKNIPLFNDITNKTANLMRNSCKILYHGIPGTGKTTIAFNTKKILNKNMILVKPNFITKPSEILLINTFKDRLYNRFGVKPLICIDEIDLIAPSRYRFNLYSEDIRSIRYIGGIIIEKDLQIISTTNMPVSIDPLISNRFRPGSLYVPLPDEGDREFIIRKCLEGPIKNIPTINLPTKDIQKLVGITKYCPGRSLEKVFEMIRTDGISNLDKIKNLIRHSSIECSIKDIREYEKENDVFLKGENNYPFKYW